MEIKVKVCNECQSLEQPTERYELKSQGKNVKLDLCKEHGQPFEKYLADAKPRGRAAAAKKTTSSRGRRRAATTIEEIEAQKKK